MPVLPPVFRIRHQAVASPGRRWTIGCALAGLLGAGAFAASVSEDFTYTPDNTGLPGKGGGSGWGASWGAGGATSRVKIDSDINLTYSQGGYAVTQAGVGRGFGDFNAFRGTNRETSTSLTGTVWFSLLVQNTLSTDNVGFQINNPLASGLDYNEGLFDVKVAGSNLVARYNGTDNTVSGVTLTLGATHLLLGRITFQDNGVNDRLELWADPVDLLSLGAASFNSASANLGTGLTLAGVFAYGGSGTVNEIQGSFDALRVSDGGGDSSAAYSYVTGVPEPSVSLLLGLGALAGLSRRRR